MESPRNFPFHPPLFLAGKNFLYSKYHCKDFIDRVICISRKSHYDISPKPLDHISLIWQELLRSNLCSFRPNFAPRAMQVCNLCNPLQHF